MYAEELTTLALEKRPGALIERYTELAAGLAWDELGAGPCTQHIWFLAYVQLHPAELLSAFEYDYFVKQLLLPGQSMPRDPSDVMGTALGLRYDAPAGLREAAAAGLTGAEYFRTRRADERIEAHLHARERKGEGGDALLRPSILAPEAWCWLHVTMRRAAFRLLLRLLSLLTPQLDAPLESYARALGSQLWFDARGDVVTQAELPAQREAAMEVEARVAFLALHGCALDEALRAEGLPRLEQLIGEAVAAAGDSCEPANALCLASLMPTRCEVGRNYDFMLDPTGRAHTAFQRRILEDTHLGPQGE
jgi:hypothetical protein